MFFHTLVPYPKNPQTRMALRFFDSGYGVWNLELPRVGRSARCAGSLPPLGVPPLLLLYRSDPGSFSPSGFRRRPRWGQLKPSGALPVGDDFIAQQETPVKGATHGFAATPLTGVSRCAFCESPTEQIAQRACSRHEPTRWGEAAKRESHKGALTYHAVASVRCVPCKARAHLQVTRGNSVRPRFPRRAQYTLSQIWRFAKGLLRSKFSARLKH